MSARYGINITTWRGSMGLAIHYYGKAWRHNAGAPRENKRNEFDEPPPRDDMTIYLFDCPVQRVLTASEAVAMNKHDEVSLLTGSTGRQAGDETNRFDDQEDVVAAGIEYLTRHYGQQISIELGDYIDCDSYIIDSARLDAIATRIQVVCDAQAIERGEFGSLPKSVFRAVSHMTRPILAELAKYEADQQARYEEEDRQRREARALKRAQGVS